MKFKNRIFALSKRRGISSSGRAFGSQSKGSGFESHILHKTAEYRQLKVTRNLFVWLFFQATTGRFLLYSPKILVIWSLAGKFANLLFWHFCTPSHAAVGQPPFTARAAQDVGSPPRGTLYPPPSKRIAWQIEAGGGVKNAGCLPTISRWHDKDLRSANSRWEHSKKHTQKNTQLNSLSFCTCHPITFHCVIFE